MNERTVWTERVWMGGNATWVRGDHWAVRVEDHKYEVGRDTEAGGSKSKILKISNEKKGPVKGTLTISGSTVKSDAEISEFNEKWEDCHPKYDLLGTNCQVYARDFVRFLVGDSYECPCPLPQAGNGTWFCKNSFHEVQEEGYGQYKHSLGRVGAIWRVFGFEAEGPKIVKGFYDKLYNGNWGAFVEASLFRVEAKIIPVRARLDLNVNTGFGIRDGQFQAKMAGFGISLGNNGAGISTPVGGLGLGKF